jgi:hypothetical protein
VDVRGACVSPFYIEGEGEPWAVARGDDELVTVVCDGSQSWGRGLEASRRGAPRIAAAVRDGAGTPVERLTRALERVSAELVAELTDEERFPPAFTVAAALVDRRGATAHVAWAGDCGVRWLRDGRLLRATPPHVLDEPEALRGVLSRVAAGHEPHLPPSVRPELEPPWALARGDRLVLGSSLALRAVGADALAAAADLPSLLAAAQDAVDEVAELTALIVAV